MASANQRLYEATIRHQVQILRFSAGEAERVLRVLAQAEVELIEKVAGALAAEKEEQRQRFERQLLSIQKRRAQVFQAVAGDLQANLDAFAQSEVTWEADVLQAVSPVSLNLVEVPIAALRAVTSSPIAGLTLDRWLDKLGQAEIDGLQRAVTQGIMQGETTDQIMGRVRGTKANAYQDGVLNLTRRNAEAITRTAVNHVSNGAREQVWEANSDIVRALRWTSTLDGRTSLVCQGRDGQMAPMPGRELEPGEVALSPIGAKPPAHFNCRSVLVAVLDGDSLAGNRPFVADTRTREARERDFRREAKRRGVDLRQVRKEWADEKVGRVPSALTYEQWLRRQSTAFQDETLGAARADLFRQGEPLAKFVDASGKKLSLDALRRTLGTDILDV